MDQKINMVLLPDIKYSDERGEHTFSYNGGASPLEQAITAFKTDEDKGKSLFLTAIGGQGKTTTLLTLWLDFIRGKNDIPCLYVDCKLLKPEDKDKAITTFIKNEYELNIVESKIESKPIILLDGVNETYCLLREKNEKEKHCFFVFECNRLIKSGWRLVISSRDKIITASYTGDSRTIAEFENNKIQYLELCSLTNEQLSRILGSTVSKKSVLYNLLSNNMMLSIYLYLNEYGIDIDQDKMNAGKLLDLYFNVCVRTRFVKSKLSSLNQYRDSELHEKIKGLEHKSNCQGEERNIYNALKNYENVINCLKTYFSDERHLKGSSLEIESKYLECSNIDMAVVSLIAVIRFNDESVYVWANEIYREYFAALYIKGEVEKLNSDFENLEHFIKWDSQIFMGASSNVIDNPITSTIYNSIQYAGELLEFDDPESIKKLLLRLTDNKYPKQPRLITVMFVLIYKYFPSNIKCIVDGLMRGCTNLTEIRILDGVESIGSRAFNGCVSLQSVKIPDSVKSIGDSAFEGCTLLSGMEIPRNVESIGCRLFVNCSSLAKIIFLGDVVNIRDGMFRGCESLTSVVSKGKVKRIGYSAFANCSLLSNINIKKSVENIDDGAFEGCVSLTDVNFFGNGVDIGPHAFKDCTSLNNIVILNGVDNLESEAFEGCTSLTSVEFHGNIKYIAPSAFWKCTALNSVKIFGSVEEVEPGAFLKCISLSSVEFFGSVEEVEFEAFAHCTALERIEFLDYLNKIDFRAFYGCHNLKIIKIPKETIIVDSNDKSVDYFKNCDAVIERY